MHSLFFTVFSVIFCCFYRLLVYFVYDINFILKKISTASRVFKKKSAQWRAENAEDG